MQYHQVTRGTFIRRLNRFIAEVVIHGKLEKVHVKNTGRLKELLVPEAFVYLEHSSNPKRSTAYSLIGVEKDGTVVNIDSQVPNTVVYDAIMNGKVSELPSIQQLKREVTFGDSRFDLYFESNDLKGFIEIKGVTLNQDGIAMFPDAPTERGTKHVLELIQAVKEGYIGMVFFLVQMKGCHSFSPHAEMDQAFADALRRAAAEGVHIIAYDAKVSETEIVIGNPLKVKLD